jgi:SAM-dependent methyltransferase
MIHSPLLKSAVMKTVPKPILHELLIVYTKLKSRKLRKIFEQAPEKPAWLGRDMLEYLQEQYPFSPEYGRDSRAHEKRGNERARDILRIVRKRNREMRYFLELGCWDGMTSCFLQKAGNISTAIDTRNEAFDERAVREGVRFLQMDAAQLCFQDESFDFVFSYNAFEHFAEPELALQEAIRVARKGGYIYLVFGPLYMSPKGSHAYRSITVPYHQFLFPEELLKDFVETKGLTPISFSDLNKLSIKDYRKMWNRYSHRLRKVRYYETYNPLHTDLIVKFPSCFKSKTHCLENLLVSDIEVLFERIS